MTPCIGSSLLFTRMYLLHQPAPTAKSGMTTTSVGTFALSAIGIELRRLSFRSFGKKRKALTKTGRDALKFSARACPEGTLIGASATNAEYWPLAGTVTLTEPVDVPASSVR